jgi:hypothetical protein
MDWLEKHSSVVNHCDNNFNSIDDFGKNITVKGIPQELLVRKISFLELKRNARKGFEIYIVYISENIEEINEFFLLS